MSTSKIVGCEYYDNDAHEWIADFCETCPFSEDNVGCDEYRTELNCKFIHEE